MLLFALLLHLARMLRLLSRRGLRPYRRRGEPAWAGYRHRRKPEWVRREVIRMKALMREAGTCRTIEALFNRRFAARRKMTVGRTWVSEVIRAHRYEIEIVGWRIKNAKPRAVPKNVVWAMDLTGKTDLGAVTHFILAILEHASRAALALEALQTKSSWNLILKLTAAVKRYGKPKAVRTDNEAVFTSRRFRFALFLLGIGHQRTDPGCPWQNGRVERFFGTLKATLDQLAVESLGALNAALSEFRFFANHVRPHQNLGGRTPAEAWGRRRSVRGGLHERMLVRSLGRIAQGLLLEEVKPPPAADE